MKLLNERHDYGVELVLLSIDEGIQGYRDDSLEALDRGAMLIKANKICTGHNADDIAETVIMNILRCDIGRLQRCTDIITGADGVLPRFKPFKYAYEKEIVMYAHARKLDYFSTECKYAPMAYRYFWVTTFLSTCLGVMCEPMSRTWKSSVQGRSSKPYLPPICFLTDIISSGEQMAIRQGVKMPIQGNCVACGYISSQEYCQACVLLKSLNDGLPATSVGVEGRRTRIAAAEIPAPDSAPTDGGENSPCNPDCECLLNH
ncbi:unnamed protein product [Schistocephalus solidus]|uniref:Zn-ribbon_14 domain-containing protein n=1 Tax=Schistocephalus solidus TaxID=70667 RepID=A0A183T007_SCHSO|nr:unnamed protein product [Schistocephalus solidus]